MRNFQDIIFIWTQTYGETFKYALVYLQKKNFNKLNKTEKTEKKLLIKSSFWDIL